MLDFATYQKQALTTAVYPGRGEGNFTYPALGLLRPARLAILEPKGHSAVQAVINLDTGETIFSTTYAEHEKAVAQWQQWCAANDSADC